VEGNGRTRGLKPFQPGQSGNPHRGPSKVSTKVKESLVKFLEDNIDAVQESFDKLKPLEKLQFVANILPYVVPKLSAIESEANVKHSGGINIRWSEPGLLDSRNKGSNGELQSIQGGVSDNSEPGGDQIGEDLHDDPTPDSVSP
jgi:hypothetical protein